MGGTKTYQFHSDIIHVAAVARHKSLSDFHFYLHALNECRNINSENTLKIKFSRVKVFEYDHKTVSC